ncbi:MAG: putative transposase [Haloechinothrix sp.]
MPEPADLRCARSGGRIVVTVGATTLFAFDPADVGMRNMAVAALRSLRFSGRRVAAAFGLSEQYVATVYNRALREGSGGLVRPSGRPGKLSERQRARAIGWRKDGVSNVEIGRRLGVHNSTVSRALAGRAQPAAVTGEPPAGELEFDTHTDSDTDTGTDTGSGPGPGSDTQAAPGADAAGGVGVERGAGRDASVWPRAAARIGEGSFVCRYAGAMLLHAFTDLVDATSVLGSVADPVPGRRFDDVAVLTAVSTVFALGFASIEQSKHPDRRQVGPIVGIDALPELRTLRPRLAALAGGCDPLDLQRAFAAAMLAADPCDTGVYFVDEHFMPYAGKLPVGKGYNTKRRCAEPGRVDTAVCDLAGRAVCFTTAEPSGLTKTLPRALAELRAITGDHAKIMLGFDRGGAYAGVFAACRQANADWITYRRAPLAAPKHLPMTVAIVRGGKPVEITLADETVTIKGYGPARQITLFEAGAAVLQILTSDTTACAGALIAFMRARWRIENLFKYLDFYGIDYLADYTATIEINTKPIDNPARKATRAHLANLRAELAQLQQRLGTTLTETRVPTSVAAANRALTRTQNNIRKLHTRIERAEHELKTIPAKLPANQINPDATIALHRARRRALQMVLRLLAANAEHWLAHQLNAYLQDDNEYRATTRNLMHLGGTITYTPQTITVELDQPGPPRLTRALTLLLEQINTSPPRIPGDTRRITYAINRP